MNERNRVQLIGNLGNDPEIRVFENGNKLAKFSLATTEAFTTKGGERSTTTNWHFIIAWGKLADRVEAECRKGTMVAVDGKLVTRNYTDKNGVKKYVTEINASQVTQTRDAAD